jgi:hypothetical protein
VTIWVAIFLGIDLAPPKRPAILFLLLCFGGGEKQAMARFNDHDSHANYRCHRSLESQMSPQRWPIFTTEKIWTSDNLEQLHQHFVSVRTAAWQEKNL